MDVFKLQKDLIHSYSNYVQSFINIADPRIKEIVDSELSEGLLWPDPLVQLNPSFEAGKTIDELVTEGILHKECANIFRKKKNAAGGDRRITLHRHQEEAIRVAARDRNYVLTTGTGSGKSLAYIVPIVDRVLKKGRGSGATAIVVYPMNALVNSQQKELEKFLNEGYPDSKGPVSFASYTGQESDAIKNEIVSKPPDILLTNYVMLELMLTRPRERPLVDAAKGLRFLVFDELHTYRGRQGSDVSLLARRAREAFEATELRFVGTSATIAAGKSFDESRVEVARVASQIFGVAVEPDDVIGETLKRATPDRDLADPDFQAELKNRLQDHNFTPKSDYESFIADPLSSWIESKFGVKKETGGRLVRAVPISLTGNDGAARKLAQATGVDDELCIDRIVRTLLAGMKIADPVAASPVFAFRLHQFISRGDTVYASIETEERRYLTLNRLRFVPGDRGKILLPLVFCRECGQDYYIVRSNFNKSKGKRDFIERDIGDRYGSDDSIPGFLYINDRNQWPIDEHQIAERIPPDWLEERDGVLVCQREKRKYLPEKVRVAPDGSEDDSGVEAQFVEAPFIFCLNCRVSYSARQRSDFSKLASLSSEGRSTATTVLGASALNLIESTDLKKDEKKILSFTDNRQDASLQAGHFNDFIEVGLLRGALYKAVKEAGDAGITHESLTHAVFNALALDIAEYASDPGVQYSAREDTDKALREVLGYRLYRDLKRGWRIASPNLEQCGLLEIAYRSLDELCRDEAVWRGKRGELAAASIETREKIAKVLLDYMRRESAIKVSYLSTSNQERIKQLSSQRLVEPWAIDENEIFESAKILYPRSRKPSRDDPSGVFLSPRGGFGQYLARNGVFPDNQNPIKLADREEIIRDLLECLRIAGLVEIVSPPTDRSEIPGYQLVAASLVWKAGDGNRPFHDPIRTPNPPTTGGVTNAFFVDFYKSWAIRLRRMSAREHTAQVPSENRIDRENRFREGKLPILFCSPTMELGVDIAGLNVVNLRNVPPTPANYAQRSGRAGRSGNPALVYTYCTTGSPHDQYFFKRCNRMVAGAVATPRLDLTNEDLVRSHVHAVWLAATGQDLGVSLGELLDLSDSQNPTLELKPEVKERLAWPKARERARERALRILKTFEDELKHADWYSERWLEDVLDKALLRFDDACDRWRDLYRAALKQRAVQDRVIVDASKKPAEKETAKRLRSEAESQMALLTQTSEIVQADFYSYRYFAGEGFLPGYNFPRLPLSAYIPGRRSGKGRDDYLSRPRFLAISEFGPRTFIYHEGSRYKINRVILPVGENDVLTQRAKICKKCGYLHPMTDEAGAGFVRGLLGRTRFSAFLALSSRQRFGQKARSNQLRRGGARQARLRYRHLDSLRRPRR